jgi:hypothetical protein
MLLVCFACGYYFSVSGAKTEPVFFCCVFVDFEFCWHAIHVTMLMRVRVEKVTGCGVLILS